jgi:hypothetical protein
MDIATAVVATPCRSVLAAGGLTLAAWATRVADAPSGTRRTFTVHTSILLTDTAHLAGHRLVPARGP